MCPCACSLSEKTKKNFQKKKSLTRKNKKDAARKSFCHFLIGNTALITWTDRAPTAVGRILRYPIHRHRFGPSSRIRPPRWPNANRLASGNGGSHRRGGCLWRRK